MKEKVTVIVTYIRLMPILFLLSIFSIVVLEYARYGGINFNDELDQAKYGRFAVFTIWTFIISVYSFPVILFHTLYSIYDKKQLQKTHIITLSILAVFLVVFCSPILTWFLG